MNKYVSEKLERISKKEAEKLFNAGESVLFVPCRMHPESPWFSWPWIEKNVGCDTFEKAYNAFWFYNCTPETGKYICFYKKRG